MFGLVLDRESPEPMQRQIAAQLRVRMRTGLLPGGTQLPPTRSLAGELNVARNTIVQVYEQLTAEGYLESRTGSGTFVSEMAGYRPSCPVPAAPPHLVTRRTLGGDILRFSEGNPDPALFPVAQWARCLRDACLNARPSLFGYGPASGEMPLRAAIAGYLLRSKGIVCEPEQVFVTPGTAPALQLLARVVAPGAPVAVEDPCIDFVPHTLRAAGCPVLGIPVDRNGLIPERLSESARLVYTVPAHQFPTGAVLPIGRRLQLLERARRIGAYVVEDDYDSEFLSQCCPIESLRHLDPEAVIYLGTFSKILSPALRVGYLIAPCALAPLLEEEMERANLRTPAIEQMALAAFLEEKLLDRHVYRMKKAYLRKREMLLSALFEAFGDTATIQGQNAGMHLMVTFPHVEFRAEDFDTFRECGVECGWAEEYALEKGRYRGSLVLGYGALPGDQIVQSVERLRVAVEKVRGKKGF